MCTYGLILSVAFETGIVCVRSVHETSLPGNAFLSDGQLFYIINLNKYYILWHHSEMVLNPLVKSIS